MAPTIKDIARRVGKSITTVSRALADYDDISPETKALVRRVAAEMGYTPNSTAQHLQKKHTDTLGLILPTFGPRFSDPFFSEFMAGIGNKATQFGYDMLVATHPPGERELQAYQHIVQSHQVDGFIIVRTRRQDPRIDYLRKTHFPFVAFGRTEADLDYPFIDEDSEGGMCQVVDHLYALGHRLFACIYPPGDLNFSPQRVNGVRSRLAELGVPIQEEWFLEGDLTQANGFELTNRVLAGQETPTAIICCNDLMALGAMSAAQDRGLMVGRDISITGFDDIPMAEHSHPPLTTLKQPIYQIGGQVCEMLVQVLRGVVLEKQHLILEPELVIRQSSGVCRGTPDPL